MIRHLCLPFCSRTGQANSWSIIDTRTLETGKPVGVPIQVRISGEDLPRLRAEAEQLKQIFRDIPIAARVRDDWGEPSAREVVHVDADRANLAHVTNADVSDSVGEALHGITAGVLRDGNKQVPIVGRMQMEERSQLSDLRSLYSFRGKTLLQCLSIRWRRLS